MKAIHLAATTERTACGRVYRKKAPITNFDGYKKRGGIAGFGRAWRSFWRASASRVTGWQLTGGIRVHADRRNVTCKICLKASASG